MKLPKPITFEARTEQGRLIYNRFIVRAALHRWPDLPVEVTIQPWRETRRTRANAFLWGVVYKLIAEETGYTVDDVHELMKLRHNSKIVADPNGEEVRIPQSTAKLKIQEFSDYMEAVMLDGAEWCGITFPEPRDVSQARTPHGLQGETQATPAESPRELR